MRLYLVQHGDALPEDVDRARPLSVNGRADVERVAALLAGQAPGISRVLHSGKTRAQQTAEILARKIACGAQLQAVSGMNPLEDPEAWAQQIDALTEDVMLVGHLPFMSRLVSRLLVGKADIGVVAFEPGTVVCLERDKGRWAIAWMLRPVLLPPTVNP
jgi:phosphohistidine phosphatase